VRIAHRTRAGVFGRNQFGANLSARGRRFGMARERQCKRGGKNKCLMNAFHDVATFE
jgi:hypothetical protein